LMGPFAALGGLLRVAHGRIRWLKCSEVEIAVLSDCGSLHGTDYRD
jgi:hypothetical protein